MHALKTLVTAAAVTLSMTACASGGSGSLVTQPHAPVANGTQLVSADNRVAAAGVPSAPATVRVANYNWLDVNVYAVQGGTRVRLGSVTSMSSGTFQLPARFLQQSAAVRLLVDPIGSTEGHMTDGVMVRGGQQISFNVQNALQLSSVSVGSR
jgi:hypothetical protein